MFGDEIDTAMEQGFERPRELEVIIRVITRRWRVKGDEKIEVTAFTVKIVPDCGSKYVKPAHGEATAEICQRGTMLFNEGDHTFKKPARG